MLAATLTWAVLGRQAWAQKNGKEQAELANALKGAKVSLEQGLQASDIGPLNETQRRFEVPFDLSPIRTDVPSIIRVRYGECVRAVFVPSAVVPGLEGRAIDVEVAPAAQEP